MELDEVLQRVLRRYGIWLLLAVVIPIADLRERAGERAEQIELSLNLFVIGDEIPVHLRRFVPVDLATLIERESLTLLRGTPREMAGELQRRRDRLGVSYLTVNGAFMEPFAPVIELLSGD